MKVETIAIIGLQKVGASVGLAIKSIAPNLTIVGHDQDKLAMKQAEEMEAVDKTYSNLINTVSAGDIVILTERLSESQNTWKHIGKGVQEHAVVVDFGTLKTPVQKWADKYMPDRHYVGMMPIPGPAHLQDSRTETTAATARLVQGKHVLPHAINQSR